DVGDSIVGRHAVLVHRDRYVAAHRVAEQLARFGNCRRHFGVIRDAERAQVLGHRLVATLGNDDLESEISQAFGEETLWRADQEDGLFELTTPAHESDLLPTVLRVMAGVG